MKCATRVLTCIYVAHCTVLQEQWIWPIRDAQGLKKKQCSLGDLHVPGMWESFILLCAP